MAMNEGAARRSCLSAGRGAVLAIHAAAGIATECDLQATRLFRAAEGICRAAVARLEQCGRISATPPSGHAAAASSPQERAAGTSGRAAASARTCSEVHEPQKAKSNKSKKKPKKQQNETADMDIVMLPIPAPSPHATVGQLTDSAEANGSLLVGDLAEFGQGSGAASVGPSSSRASGVAAIAATIKHDVNMGKEQGSTAASASGQGRSGGRKGRNQQRGVLSVGAQVLVLHGKHKGRSGTVSSFGTTRVVVDTDGTDAGQRCPMARVEVEVDRQGRLIRERGAGLRFG